jgi:hypothetical protein
MIIWVLEVVFRVFLQILFDAISNLPNERLQAAISFVGIVVNAILTLGLIGIYLRMSLTQRNQANALESQAETQSDQADALEEQAETQAKQADALEDQVDALESQAETQSDQADALEEQAKTQAKQADALEDQAETQSDQADALKEQANQLGEQFDYQKLLNRPEVILDSWSVNGDEVKVKVRNVGESAARNVCFNIENSGLHSDVKFGQLGKFTPRYKDGNPITEILPADGVQREYTFTPEFACSYNGNNQHGPFGSMLKSIRRRSSVDEFGVAHPFDSIYTIKSSYSISWETYTDQDSKTFWNSECQDVPLTLEELVNSPPVDMIPPQGKVVPEDYNP